MTSNALSKSATGETVCDHTAHVQTVFQHRDHLVPCLEYLAAIDAFDGDRLGRRCGTSRPGICPEGFQECDTPAHHQGFDHFDRARPVTRTFPGRHRSPASALTGWQPRRDPPPSGSPGTTSATCPASANRSGFKSVMTTWRAPTCRATAAAIMPIGPAPVTSTSSPTKSKLRAVWTALPNGSKIDPISSSIASGSGTTLKAGRRRYSAKAPGSLTPIPRVSGSRLKFSRTALARGLADQMPLTRAALTDGQICDVFAQFDDLTGKFMSGDQANRKPCVAPSRPSSRCGCRSRRCRSC